MIIDIKYSLRKYFAKCVKMEYIRMLLANLLILIGKNFTEEKAH